jgi:hypothetical protein
MTVLLAFSLPYLQMTRLGVFEVTCLAPPDCQAHHLG